MNGRRFPTRSDSCRPRVLHVVNALDGGGTERVLIAFLRAVAGDGADHVVCTLREPGELADQVPPGVAVEALGCRGTDRLSALRLVKVVRRYRPDVIHARGVGMWMDAAIAAGCCPQVELLLGFHGMQTDAGFTPRQRRRARWLRRRPARFVCVSLAGREQLQRELALPADRIHVIPNGVDANRFAPADADRRRRMWDSFGWTDHDCVLGSVGSLTPVKDQAATLSAVAALTRHRCVRLLLVGEGPLDSELRDQARRLGIDGITTFAGRRADVPDLLAAIDVYVSTSRYEGQSNAILEAMAAGLPVVATDVGDNRRMIEPGCGGEIVAVRDGPALVDAIDRLARDSDLRRRYGAHARRRAIEQHGFEPMVRRYVELYRSATKTPAPSAR